MALYTPDQLASNDEYYLIEENIEIFAGQFVPIYVSYSKEKDPFIISQELHVLEASNGRNIFLKPGDKVWLSMGSPAHGHPDCANSYTVKFFLTESNKTDYCALLSLIPPTCPGGALNDEKHYCAVQQIKNLQDILTGKTETYPDYTARALKVYEELIPKHDFYFGKPYNSRSGYEIQKVLYRNGEYLRLRSDAWMTKEELMNFSESYADATEEDIFNYNVWGHHKSAESAAWHGYYNACVISPDKESIDYHLWSKNFDSVRQTAIERYKENEEVTV